MQFDVAIVGGSYAGMSAAMQVARARKNIVVIDSGRRRNRFAPFSHGFLGQDGRPPEAIAGDARAQLLAYPTVTWVDHAAAEADIVNGGFAIRTVDGQSFATKRVVLATGVVDDLPDIPGLAERWGKSVFHCPYCHGYELDRGRLGVLAVGPVSMHQAMLIPEWGETTLFTNDTFELDARQQDELAARGVAVETTPVAAISDTATVRLTDGRGLVLDGLFTAPTTRMASPLAEQLGCAFDAGPVGSFIRTDVQKQTSVAGVFACGDAARAAGSVALAVGDGAIAGTAAHRSLIF